MCIHICTFVCLDQFEATHIEKKKDRERERQREKRIAFVFALQHNIIVTSSS